MSLEPTDTQKAELISSAFVGASDTHPSYAVDQGFDSLQRTMIIGFVTLFASIVASVIAGILATQL
ncbi:MAG TPA: hypothetical protein VFX44_09860 [Solirubrobacterales bacterium]|nr:hypothetical protein [Solirubrobacterales bacterium]